MVHREFLVIVEFFMLLVQTKLGLSKIQGIGLFADQHISKGSLIWKFRPYFDLCVEKCKILSLSEPAKLQFLRYAYLNSQTNMYVLCFDDARYFNHSDNPNCKTIESLDDKEGVEIAGKDIQKGEELTVNYKEYDAEYNYKMSI